ncbi:hypothetical protein [Micromonospora avicenniae]|uniref:Uncharacterized protein n=1 Tax=Micromonospora avicenniae TaxID=1198245 RepID=A0A1N7EV75_9ACTN|nr:hypothetical protein [Micromonospora avicenniae]SIR91959.1 hypothetical protein SAMN05444858_12759 [Micromonospora avicenniae]
MAILAEGLDALNVRARAVIEIAQIREPDGYLQAIQLVFTDGLSLTLTVWTDWRLVAELRSQVEMPDYLWPPEAMTRSVIDQTTGPVSEVVPSHNQVGELVEVRFTVGNRRMLVGSFAGDLTIELSQADDGGRR